MANTPLATTWGLSSRGPVKGTSAVIWSTDTVLRLVECCGEVAAKLERDLSLPSTGQTLSEFFQIDSSDAPFIAAHHRALAGDIVSVDFDWAGRGFRACVAPQRNTQMHIVGCLGLAQEITEKIEDHPSEIEQQFRVLVELLPAGVYLTDAEGNCTYVNERWCDMAGMEPEQCLGQGWVRGVHPEDRDRIKDRWHAIAGSGDEWGLEYRMQTPEGKTTWIFGLANALHDNEGKVTGYLGINLDITDRKNVEEILRKSQQRYSDLLSAVTSYTYSVKIENNVPASTTHGPGCAATTGYTPEEYAANPSLWIEMVHLDDRDEVRQCVANVLRQESVPPIEHRILHKDGTIRWVRDTIVCHRDEMGRLVRYDGLVEDITERKRGEVRLHQVLESAPDAMVLVDQEGRIVLVNTETERVFGYGREELLQRPVDVLLPERFQQSHVQQRAKYSTSPRPVLFGERSGLVGRRKDGSEFPAEIGLSPIETEEGALILAAVRDITQRQGMEKQLQSNLLVQSALNSLLALSLEPLPLEEYLGRSLDSLFTIPWIELESKGSVFLVEGDSQTLVMKAQHGLPHGLLTACEHVPFGHCICGRAAATRQTAFTHCIDEHHETSYAEMLPHGHYCVPIVTDDELLGVLNLYVKHGHEKTPQEERFLSAVANILAGTIKRGRVEQSLREREGQLIAAQRIQEHILPRAAPAIPGFDLAGGLIAAEFAAGDYFDYLPMADGSLGIVVGDVCGHGVGAALLMASTAAHLRSFVQEHSDLRETLRHTNTLLCREVEFGSFVTLLFVRLDLSSRTIQYVNAGHPFGYVLDHSAKVKAKLEGRSLPLALFPDSDFSVNAPIELEPGDVIVLVTDGVQEASSPDGAFFGTERMLEIVRANRDRKAKKIIEVLQVALREFVGCGELQDDVTVVVIKVEASADSESV